MTSETKPLKKITIVGGGQMGTSTALAAQEAYPDAEIVVIEIDPTQKEPFENKFKLEGVPFEKVQFTQDPSMCAGSDIVVLCTPISQFATAIEAMAPHIDPQTVLTDIGSVKGLSMKRIKKALKKFKLLNEYVPFHILNGNAGSGPLTGSKDIYKAPGVLVPGQASQEAENCVAAFFKNLGARLFKMEAPKHDKLLGMMSHLEYLAMFAFMETPLMHQALSSDGLKDPGNWITRMTRIADAGAEMWASIFGDNKKQILASAEEFRSILLDLKGNLEETLKQIDRAGDDTGPETGLHHFANTTLDSEQKYAKERPNFPIKPFAPQDLEDQDLRLSAMAALLSFAIAKNGKRVQDETGQLLAEIANPSFKDGLGPLAVAPEAVKELLRRYKNDIPQMIDDYLTQFDLIAGKIRGLDSDGPSTDDRNRPTYAQNCRDVLKKIIVNISANRKNLPRAFSRTLERFGVRPRAGHCFNTALMSVSYA